jgi:Radical SAM superfamily
LGGTLTASPSERPRQFFIELIKPAHYDDDGYVIQWVRSAMPSNTLAQLYGLAADCADRNVLGPDVALAITTYDETNTRIDAKRIARKIRRGGGRGLIALVGVQSNQFPRAVDLARQFRAEGLPVCIGGFHVSGCLAMLPKLPDDIQAAIDMGVSIFAGEAEGRLERVLRDAWAGTLEPIYNYMDDLPSLEGAVTPILPAERVQRTVEAHTSFDAGRGCPFQCSFCTIINVQGRKSRYRSADDVERLVRANLAKGIRRFFITDDNFARNKNWEAIFDRLGDLREKENFRLRLIIQVDTLCHLIPNFVAKAGRAGVYRVFIGLESINPQNLLDSNKRQNRITEYRRMLQAWKGIKALTYCGYILGFPTDTPERILNDIEIIKRELPIDLLEFFCLTPLPGSADHKKLYDAGAWMDPDMNNYDLEHVTAHHPLMTAEAWRGVYQQAWHSYYSPDHVETIFRRAHASGMSVGKVFALIWKFYGSQAFEHVHPLQGGYFRRKVRRDRRPGLPIEPALPFYAKRFVETATSHARFAGIAWRYLWMHQRIKRDPASRHWRDLALTPVTDGELSTLELFSASEAAHAAVERTQMRRKAPRPAESAAGSVAG